MLLFCSATLYVLFSCHVESNESKDINAAIRKYELKSKEKALEQENELTERRYWKQKYWAGFCAKSVQKMGAGENNAQGHVGELHSPSTETKQD